MQESAPKADHSMACPFPIHPGDRIRVKLKNGRTFEGKLISCDAQISMRSGILYRTFDADHVSEITPK